MKIHFLVLMFVWASLVLAQTADQGQAPDAGPTILTRGELQIPPEAATGMRGDYFNFSAFADFTYNSYEPFATYVGAVSGIEGFDAGLGVSLLHYFPSGAISLNYTGGYREYPGLNTDPVNNIIQNLNLGFNKQFNRRLLFTFGENAGWNPGGWIPHPVITPEFALGLNLVAVRYESSLTSVGLSYLQTKRLSWQFGGDFSELRYVPTSNFGSFGAMMSAGLNYRLTKRTTVGATASYQYFSFLQLHGTSQSDGAYLSLSHQFGPRIEVGVSGGALRTSYGAGSADVVGSTPLTGGSHAIYSPFASGRLSISRKRVSFGLSGGEAVSAGNGIFLTSKMIYAGGGLTYAATRKWSFGLSGGYQRFVSINGGASSPDEYASGSIDYKLSHHIGVRASGSYTSYETITIYQGHSYYNIIAGVFFTSADRPLSSIF
jgi:hypothetical protein